jgi:hypothetical protein
MSLKFYRGIRKSLLNTSERIRGIATGRSRLITQEDFLRYYRPMVSATLFYGGCAMASTLHPAGNTIE